MIEGFEIVTLSALDVQNSNVVSLLQRIYFDDPCHKYFFQNPAKRKERQTKLWEWTLGICSDIGNISILKEVEEHNERRKKIKAIGVSLCYLSDKLPNNSHYFVNGFWKGLLWGMNVAKRFMNFGLFTKKAHDDIMGNRLHLYIQLVGVDIPYQKQGFGGLLLANAVKRADELGIEAYLECTSEINIPFFLKYGFVVQDTIKIGVDEKAPIFWLMKRAPSSI